MKLFLLFWVILFWALLSSGIGFYLYQETLRLEEVAEEVTGLAFDVAVRSLEDHQKLRKCELILNRFGERRSL